jgi:shikimate kinase
VADIFREKGEPYFRAVEREVFYSLVPLRHTVVATGGGTFLDPDTRAAMLADGLVVWLDLPFPALVHRVPTDGRRPLAADRATLESLYLARRAIYQQAHLRLDAGGSRPEGLVEQVLEHLES